MTIPGNGLQGILADYTAAMNNLERQDDPEQRLRGSVGCCCPPISSAGASRRRSTIEVAGFVERAE